MFWRDSRARFRLADIANRIAVEVVCGRYMAGSPADQPPEETMSKNVADAIRAVTTKMQDAGARELARPITGQTLVDLLLAIADELDAEYARPSDAELIDCPMCGQHDWNRADEDQPGNPIKCRNCGNVEMA